MEIWLVIGFVLAITASAVAWKVAPYCRFAYPTAKVQAIGNPFVRERELYQLMESKSIESFKNALNSLRDYNVEGERAAEIQRSLDEHFVKTMLMIRKDSPKKLKGFYDSYLRLIDSMAIKTALKSKILGKEIEFIPTILPETERLVERISSIEELVGFDEEVIDAINKKDLLALDTAIDRMYLRELKKVRVPREARDARDEFVSRLLDIKNLKNLFRAKNLGYEREDYEKLFIEEGREIPRWKFMEIASSTAALEGTSYHIKDEESIQSIENALDRFLLKAVEDISIKNFPLFGPLLRFMVAKEFEIRNLKIIVKGIEEGVEIERIKSLLILEE
jgi:V/A-type H+-transporting ATPase subunit C